MSGTAELRVRVLSDVERFDLTRAADGLDDLADGAERSGRALDDAAREADGAGDKIRALGRTGDASGRDVSQAFDKIGHAARKARTDTASAASGTRSSLRGVSDEAAQTSREMGASFSGAGGDMVDAVQEASAQALSALGPLGAGIGLAAAMGIGVLRAKAEALRQLVSDLTDDLIESGRLSDETVLDRIAEAAKSGDLDTLARDARAAGVPVRELMAAYGDADDARAMIERLSAAQSELLETQRRITNPYQAYAAHTEGARSQSTAILGVIERLRDQADAYDAAERAAALYASVTGISARVSSAYRDTLGRMTSSQGDAAAATERAAQRMADATKDSGDSWQDYADTVALSVDDVLAAQTRQLQAALDMETNTAKVYDRLGQDAVAWALAQGEAADDAMALLAGAPIAKGRQIAANYRKLGATSGRAIGEGISSQEDSVRRAAESAHAIVARIFGQPVTVQIRADASAAYAQAARVRAEIADLAQGRFRP